MGPLGVHGGIPLVGRDLVVEVHLRVGPVPLGDDDVPLLALRPGWRLRWQFAGEDPIGPVREHLQCRLSAHPVEMAAHAPARLSGLDAPIPRGHQGVEIAELGRDLPRGLVAERMTHRAATRFHGPDPLGLALHAGRDAITLRPRARELVLVRHMDQG